MLRYRTQAAAEALARRGWPVLPCHHPTAAGCSCRDAACASPAKHPRPRRGLHDASVELGVIRRWWRAWPEANVAVRTGARPDCAGLVVLDVDPDHGGEASLAHLAQSHGLPATLEVATGGGGRHLYFAHPGQPVPNSAGRLGPGLDVRGDGGYVLVPPSRHASGGRYLWRPHPIAPLPDWLGQRARPASSSAPRTTIGPLRDAGSWTRAALAGEVATVRASAEGCRNHALNRAAFALGQLVGGGCLDEDDVRACLTDAALAVGLGAKESEATITSGLRAGTARPRGAPPS